MANHSKPRKLHHLRPDRCPVQEVWIRKAPNPPKQTVYVVSTWKKINGIKRHSMVDIARRIKV